MKRPSIRVPDTVVRLARRAAKDVFPPIPTDFPKGSASDFGFGPGSDTASTAPGGSSSGNPTSSGTPTSGMPSPATGHPGDNNNSSSSSSTALATASAAAAAVPARLSPAAVGGIAVGCFLFLLALVVVVWLVVRRRRQDCHGQLDDGASDRTGSSRLHVDDTVPLAKKTVAAEIAMVVDEPLSLSLWPGGGSAHPLPVPPPPAGIDAPPAYEEVSLHGHPVTITNGLQSAPEINSVPDGFRRYGPAFEGGAKGFE